VGIWVIVCIQKQSLHFLQTFRPLRMFKIVFRDSSLYRKQLSLFCLLWLSTMSSKTAGVKIEAFRHLIMSQQGKRKTKNLLDFYITKIWKFTCVLYAHCQFLCSLARFDLANRGARQPVQPHTFCAPLLVFDKTVAQPHFAVVNCSHAMMSVFYSPVLTRTLIFLQLWTAVS